VRYGVRQAGAQLTSIQQAKIAWPSMIIGGPARCACNPRRRISRSMPTEIMGLSVRTVTFHIGNVVKKLHASNKTAAAVRAAVLGLLG
jgi:hypothetical protein